MDDVHSHLVSVLAGLPRRRLLVGSTDVVTPNAELDFLPTASSYGITTTECSACIAARSKHVTLSEWRGSRPPELQASAGTIELVRQGLTDYASGSTKLTWAPREIGADDDHVIEVSEITLEALSACSAYVSFSPNHTTAGKGWILTVIWDLSNPVDPNDAHVLVAPQSQPEAMVTIPLEFKGVRGLGLAHETLELKGLNAYTSLEHTLPSGITGHVSVLETSTCVHSSVSVVDGVMHVQTRETPDACAYHICGRSVLLRVDRGPSLTPLYERVAFEHSLAHELRAKYWLTITRFGTEVIQLFERPDGGILPYYPERLPYTYEALLACGWQKRAEIAAGSDDVDWHVVELADQPSWSPIRIIQTTENDSSRLAWTRAAFGSLR